VDYIKLIGQMSQIISELAVEVQTENYNSTMWCDKYLAEEAKRKALETQKSIDEHFKEK